MNAHDLRLRHGKHAKRVIGAQVFFAGEREFGEVCQHLEITRVNACCIKRLTVMRPVLVNVVQRGFEPLVLQRGNFVPAGLF